MLIWKILKQSVSGFIAHEALSRGAAIAFYIVTSLAPVLLIVVAVAGLVFGQDAVRGSLVKELGGLFGKEGGELIQAMLASASDKPSSTIASIFGVLMVIVTASGVFSEMQAALNRTWDVDSSDQPWFSLIKTRAASLGLVAALGFLLMVSLAASAALSAFGNYIGAHTAFAPIILSLLNTIISLLLFTLLFAAIFKVLPDTPIGWRDVGIGAFVTAVLFTIGKSLIGWYLGTTAASSGYGAAGALILILLWSYYSAQIFLFGAEITRAVAGPSAKKQSTDPQIESPGTIQFFSRPGVQTQGGSLIQPGAIRIFERRVIPWLADSRCSDRFARDILVKAPAYAEPPPLGLVAVGRAPVTPKARPYGRAQIKERQMKTKQLILAGCGVLALSVGAAQAGPCDTVGKSTQLRDAGSGPTPGNTGQQATAGLANSTAAAADKYDEHGQLEPEPPLLKMLRNRCKVSPRPHNKHRVPMRPGRWPIKVAETRAGQ